MFTNQRGHMLMSPSEGGASVTCDDVIQEGGGHAEDPHQEVAHGEVQDEQVGDGPHVFAPQHDEADDSVSHHAHQEDQQVGDDEDGRRGRLVQVKSHVGDVPRRAALRGGVVERPVVVRLSQVVFQAVVHFKPVGKENAPRLRTRTRTGPRRTASRVRRYHCNTQNAKRQVIGQEVFLAQTESLQNVFKKRFLSCEKKILKRR